MLTRSRTGIVRALVLISVVLPFSALAQLPGGLFIFGDSLSDSGNFFHHIGTRLKPPFEPIAGAPYAIGGNHFSNGATWVEQLAVDLGKVPSAHPALVRPGRFTNYAFGRARARANAPIFPLFDLTTQVSLFLSDFGGNAPSDGTYIFFIGSNDARDAFTAGGDPAIVADAVNAVATNIAALTLSGARRFVVMNIPNLGITPAVNGLPDPVPLLATLFSAAYNDALAAALDAVEPLVVSRGGQIIRIDVFALLNAVVADGGAAAGLSNVTDACLTYGVKGRFMCRNPNEYLFWDDAHPTRAGHAALLEQIADLISAP